jgi:predicted DsbA family dithiol-disulfide isomerase
MVHDKDTSDSNVLADIADSVDIFTRDEVRSETPSPSHHVPNFSVSQALAFLKTDEFEAEVKKIAEVARAKGISGVPVTVIDGKWAVSGGQSADVFIQVCPLLPPSYL